MKSFKHINATTVEQASKLLREGHGKARLNAGGTDLLSTLKDKILVEYPETIINLKTIPSMNYIREDRNVLMIGATAKLADIAQSPLVREKYGLLADAVEAVATPNIRNMATIGGNLCQDTRCWYSDAACRMQAVVPEVPSATANRLCHCQCGVVVGERRRQVQGGAAGAGWSGTCAFAGCSGGGYVEGQGAECRTGGAGGHPSGSLGATFIQERLQGGGS